MTASGYKPLNAMTLGEVAAIMGGDAEPPYERQKFAAISTDSRTIQPGEVYLALKGEVHDGHKFVKAAIARGASAVIVNNDDEQPTEVGAPMIHVPDTLAGYGDLARAFRDNWGGCVIAISGSVGKTTTRRMAAHALSGHLKTLEPLRNFNNLIGVPQTLLRLEADHQIAVLELGMNMPGELARLTQIARPNVAGLTMIGMTHVGMFKSHEELIAAKLSLFENTEAGAPLVVNARCANSRRALDLFGDSHPIVTFADAGNGEGANAGAGIGAHCRVANVRPAGGEPGWRFDLITPAGASENLRLRHFGRHLLEDVAAAAALLFAAGLDPAWVAESVESFETEPLRGQIVPAGEWTFIMDCYNAAPDSMAASLASLGALMAARRAGATKPGGTNAGGGLALALADMLELGDHSREAHEAMLAHIRPLGPARFFGLGPESARLAATLAKEGWRAGGFDSREAMAEAMRSELRPGDWVLFKGSHGFALEKVARALAPEAHVMGGADH